MLNVLSILSPVCTGPKQHGRLCRRRLSTKSTVLNSTLLPVCTGLYTARKTLVKNNDRFIIRLLQLHSHRQWRSRRSRRLMASSLKPAVFIIYRPTRPIFSTCTLRSSPPSEARVSMTLWSLTLNGPFIATQLNSTQLNSTRRRVVDTFTA